MVLIRADVGRFGSESIRHPRDQEVKVWAQLFRDSGLIRFRPNAPRVISHPKFAKRLDCVRFSAAFQSRHLHFSCDRIFANFSP